MLKCLLSFLAPDKPFCLFVTRSAVSSAERRETVQEMQEEKIVFSEESVIGSGKMVRIETKHVDTMTPEKQGKVENWPDLYLSSNFNGVTSYRVIPPKKEGFFLSWVILDCGKEYCVIPLQFGSDKFSSTYLHFFWEDTL